MTGLAHEVRFTFRQLRRNPAFTIAAVLTLAVGIGANTAVFTVVQNVLLARLPYPNANRIFAIETKFAKDSRQTTRVTGGDSVDLRQQNAFERFSLYFGGEMGIQLKDHSAFTKVILVNADFPAVFGISPLVGRAFEEGEARESALVRQSFAESNFGSAQAAVGQTITVEGKIYTISGVLPSGFDFPHGAQVWLGTPSSPSNVNRTGFNYRAIALLRSDASQSAAQQQIAALSNHLAEQFPESNSGKSFAIVPLQEQLVGKIRPMLLMLMAAVGLILLIACANLANLQFARATTRFREIAVRTALGASKMAIARLMILESFVLAVSGALIGILIGVPLLQLVLTTAPEGIPRLNEVHLNTSVFAFTFAVSLIATTISGLASAAHVRKPNLTDALKQDASRGTVGRPATRLRAVLVVSEVALTLVLAVAAGLLVRTMQSLTNTQLGFRTDRLLVTYAHAPARTDSEYLARPQQFETLFEQLRGVPGVQSVAAVVGLPTGLFSSSGKYQVEGVGPSDFLHSNLDSLPEANFTLASPNYFFTMGIPFLRGHDFSNRDQFNGEFVAIISESLALQSFGGTDPIGKKIRCGFDSLNWMTVVGVVGDVRQDSPASRPGPSLYMPLTQHPRAANEIQIVSRTSVSPASLIDTYRSKILTFDPTIATKFTTMDNMIGDSVAVHRFRTILIGGFALLGFLLACVGVYGVIGYTVAQRTYEVGVRMTFGAVPKDILRMIMLQAAKLTVLGVIVGTALSLGATRLMQSMLVGVKPSDPVTFVLACALILFAGLGAAFLPALRAASVDPLRAIRCE